MQLQKKENIVPSRALISVYDKTGLIELAKICQKFRIEIISTGGTAKILREHGIKVSEISHITGFPEILGGRVKTLQPQIHGGILARRHLESDLDDLSANSIQLIDMVVVNLYPFAQTIAKPGVDLAEVLENIDIGGPCMLRAAAKNFPDVIVISHPDQYQAIAEEMEAQSGGVSFATRAKLAQAVFNATQRYDAMIFDYFQRTLAADLVMPAVKSLSLVKVQDLRYGENPHQQAALYAPNSLPVGELPFGRQLHGKELSFNNLLDINAVIGLGAEFAETACVIVKHNNPCGVAIADSPAEAFEKARLTDPVSAFGGIVGFNRTVDQETASALVQNFFEVIVAPAFSPESLEILGQKKNLRLIQSLTRPGTEASLDVKAIVGGFLIQTQDAGEKIAPEFYRVVSKRQPTASEWQSMLFGWRIIKWVKSNAVIYVAGDRTLGIGAGQMSRVDSSRLAVMKASQSGLDLKGSAVASDAFFPFRDGIDAAAEAGASAVIQPGGSIRDEEVIAAADEHHLTMVFTGYRHFRH